MGWTDYIVGKYGAVFSDGVVLKPGSIVMFNGSVFGSYVSLVVKEDINAEPVTVSSKFDNEYDEMVKKGILTPAKDVIEPLTEAKFEVGDIVTGRYEDASIIAGRKYSYHYNKWYYMLAGIDDAGVPEKNQYIVFRNKEFIANNYFEEEDLKKVESATEEVEINDINYSVTYREVL